MKYKRSNLEYILQFVRIQIVSTNSFLNMYSTSEIIVVDSEVRENILMFGENESKFSDFVVYAFGS